MFGPCGEVPRFVHGGIGQWAIRELRDDAETIFRGKQEIRYGAGTIADADLIRSAHGHVVQAVTIEVAAGDSRGVLMRDARVDKRCDGIGE